jgi:hypothetical protein
MPTKEEKIAKQKMANAKAKVRTLLMAGRTADAEAYAAEQGFDVFAARLAPEYQSPAEPFFAALEAAKNAPTEPAVMDLGDETPPPAPDAVAMPEEINGYPVLTDAVVWGIPPNKSLVVIELPDKRRVSMWRTRKTTYRIYMKLRARLVKTEGDPIYEEVMPERAAF